MALDVQGAPVLHSPPLSLSGQGLRSDTAANNGLLAQFGRGGTAPCSPGCKRTRQTMWGPRWLTAAVCLGAVSLPTLATDPRGPEERYDALCEEIIQHGQAAARSHNAGRADDVQSFSAKADAAYRAAVLLAPGEPQAHANMAVFTLNSQRWEESVAFWRLALDTLQGQPQTAAMFKGRLRFAQLRALGTRRNAAYRGGQGNITEALALAREELALMRTPEILADIGVLQTMLAEDDPGLFDDAGRSYAQAQDVAFSGWAEAQRQQGRCGGEAAELGGVERSWVSGPEVALLPVSLQDDGAPDRCVVSCDAGLFPATGFGC